MVLTSGGLGPTADDLTAEVVGSFQGREMVLDEALEGRIAEILRPLAARYPNLDRDAIAHGNRKQATIPRGATVLEPVGTAPGLVVSPAEGSKGPTVVVLPGPPRELQPMWKQAVATEAWRSAIAGARVYRVEMLRLFGIPESEIAETLRHAEREGVNLSALEITTCLRSGEIEIVTRYEPDAQSTYDELAQIVATRHADTLYSTDGTTIDAQVAALLRGERLGGSRPHRPAGGEPDRLGSGHDTHDCRRRVVYRRTAAGTPDRPAGRLRVRAGWSRGLLERGQDRPSGRPARDDRSPRRRFRAGGSSARRGRAHAARQRAGSGAYRHCGPGRRQ